MARPMTPYVSHSDVLPLFAATLAGRTPLRVNTMGRAWGWGWTCHRCYMLGVMYADHASALAAALDHCADQTRLPASTSAVAPPSGDEINK